VADPEIYKGDGEMQRSSLVVFLSQTHTVNYTRFVFAVYRGMLLCSLNT